MKPFRLRVTIEECHFDKKVQETRITVSGSHLSQDYHHAFTLSHDSFTSLFRRYMEMATETVEQHLREIEKLPLPSLDDGSKERKE